MVIGGVLFLGAFVLALAQSARMLHASQFIRQGLCHVTAHAVSVEIERALTHFTLAFFVLAGLAMTRQRSRRAVFGALDRLRASRLFVVSAGISGALVLGGYAAALGAARAPAFSGPNVLFIVFDTVRTSNLSLYGHFRDTTPNIDRFAEHAVVFENAFAIGAWTILTLAELMSERGYDTAGFANNVNVSRRKGFAQGFRHYLDMFRDRVREPYEQGRDVPDGDVGAFATHYAVLEWLEARGASEAPYFMFINYIEAHSPYEPPEHLARRYIEDGEARSPNLVKYDYVDFLSGKYQVSDEEFELAEALYDAEIRYLDQQVGALLGALEERGALANTLVVITSDHGESFGEHGLVGHQFGLYDTVLRVPLIVRPPGSIVSGTRLQRWVELSDLFATILEITGVASAAELASKSRSVFDAAERTSTVAEYYKPLKYLRRFEKRYPEFDRSPYDRRIRSWRERPYKLIWSSDGRHELYDVEADRDETRDLSSDRVEELARLTDRIEEWRARSPLALAGASSTHEPKPDAEMRAELKALGYIEE